jgi:acetolactate decarboxylase
MRFHLETSTVRLRRLLFATLLLTALASLPASSAPDQGTPALFQVSTIDALMAGLYDGVMTVHDLRAQGDFGLGTFDHLDGEMVVLGGRVYRVSSDGAARVVPDGTRTPFAAVTVFRPERTEQIESVAGLSALTARLDRMLPRRTFSMRFESMGSSST